SPSCQRSPLAHRPCPQVASFGSLQAPTNHESRAFVMSTSRFSWAAFDAATVHAIALTLGYPPDLATPPVDCRSSRFKRPTPELARRLKPVLVEHWLPSYRGAGRIVRELMEANVGPMGAPRSQADFVAYIDKCRNTKTIQRLLANEMIQFGDMDRH